MTISIQLELLVVLSSVVQVVTEKTELCSKMVGSGDDCSFVGSGKITYFFQTQWPNRLAGLFSSKWPEQPVSEQELHFQIHRSINLISLKKKKIINNYLYQ